MGSIDRKLEFDNNIYDTIRQNIKRYRKEKGITSAELAEMTGNSQQSISRFEQKTHSSSMKLFSSIINALGYEVQLVKKGSV